jgi:hypothetical protein
MNNHTMTIRRAIVLICILSAAIVQYSLFRRLPFIHEILSNGIQLFAPTSIMGGLPLRYSQKSNQLIDKSFQRAYEESLGFFDDVPEDEWMRRKKITLAQTHLVQRFSSSERHGKIKIAPYWYATNWHPDFHCGYEDFVGLGGDGGKWVCDPHRLLQKEKCIVYSIGSNGKFDFEININLRLPHCEVHIFDFTDYSEAMTKLHINAFYHSWGLGSSSGRANVKRKHNRTFKSFRETVQELGHVGRTIDIFKIDCEECEVRTIYTICICISIDMTTALPFLLFSLAQWISYLDWFNNSGVEGIQQILLEAHYVPHITAENMFQYVHDQGYVIFHKEPNIQFGGGTYRCCHKRFRKMIPNTHVNVLLGTCVEFGFLRLNHTYFLDT